ncbi:MAG: pyridoxal-phosphate dependent enzyme [Ilumatobacteraceae bacterium]|nr:pyridoxal-phosphate dependent enzyme [Ilumatobacteraceae bacterium]
MTTLPINTASSVAARAVGQGIVKHTPVTESAALSERCGGKIVLKAENLQRTGSFKIRGALNKVASLGDAANNGVTAGSAGNHAQALAFAARHRGVPCEIFVPTGASLAKIDACRGYGATIIEGGDTLDIAVAQAQERARATGMAFCHPYDDASVVVGQGTLGLELIEDITNLSCVLIPLGGGGLTGGVAVVLKEHNPNIRIIGVQVAVCAPYAGQPAADGPITTLADGIAVKKPGEITRPLIERYVDDIVIVQEDDIADAMMMLMERAKLYVEGGGAVGVAALLSGVVKPSDLGTTCVVLSGGNVDLGVVPGLIRRHETDAGRRLILFVRIADRPGGLAQLLTLFAQVGANLIEVEHVRDGVDLHVRETGVQVVLEIRGPEQEARVIAAAQNAGYVVQKISGR